jgi:hypothetical protein
MADQGLARRRADASVRDPQTNLVTRHNAQVVVPASVGGGTFLKSSMFMLPSRGIGEIPIEHNDRAGHGLAIQVLKDGPRRATEIAVERRPQTRRPTSVTPFGAKDLPLHLL